MGERSERAAQPWRPASPSTTTIVARGRVVRGRWPWLGPIHPLCAVPWQPRSWTWRPWSWPRLALAVQPLDRRADSRQSSATAGSLAACPLVAASLDSSHTRPPRTTPRHRFSTGLHCIRPTLHQLWSAAASATAGSSPASPGPGPRQRPKQHAALRQ
jgi:hypothetical protein